MCKCDYESMALETANMHNVLLFTAQVEQTFTASQSTNKVPIGRNQILKGTSGILNNTFTYT